MLSPRWSGAIASAVLAAGLAALYTARSGEVAATSHEEADAGPGLFLSGCLTARGVDLLQYEARCTPMRLEEPGAHVHRAALDRDGCFVLGGLADTDHVLEIVLRDDPTLVVARREFVRPGADVVLEVRLPFVFGQEYRPRATE